MPKDSKNCAVEIRHSRNAPGEHRLIRGWLCHKEQQPKIGACLANPSDRNRSQDSQRRYRKKADYEAPPAPKKKNRSKGKGKLKFEQSQTHKDPSPYVMILLDRNHCKQQQEGQEDGILSR